MSEIEEPSLLPTAPAAAAPAYRVLARKYRPQSFADLIGQDAMVTTLANAFASGRIAQGYMLTGVRGIGKTTTARLIARALNYQAPGATGPVIDMPGFGDHCEAILEGRHPDVIEMDAASNTGVDNMREIIEAVRYRPITARYKVYIIDEVHMLSKSAFNALLKTLEEPPEHVKFIFATTEIRKVPVTILSRCQRFDLRRLDGALLMRHFGSIAQKEGASAEEEALRLIARASEGSVRDGLSLLDQAITYGGANITAQAVQSMLGLIDRGRVMDLFEQLMKGEAAAALESLAVQYKAGGDPITILTDLADFVHWVTRLKVNPQAVNDPSRAEAEKIRGSDMAKAVPMAAITRAWQMLLKGLTELRDAPDAMAAAEMVLIRLAYAAELPPTEELVKKAQSAKPAPRQPAPAREPQAAGHEEPRNEGALALNRDQTDAPTASAVSAPALMLGDFRAIVALAAEKRDIKLKTDLERFVRPVRVGPGQVEIGLEPKAPPTLAGELARKLEGWTGRRWMVLISKEEGERPLYEQEQEARDTRIRDARANPAVQAIMARFPTAEIKEVREPESFATVDELMSEKDET